MSTVKNIQATEQAKKKQAKQLFRAGYVERLDDWVFIEVTSLSPDRDISTKMSNKISASFLKRNAPFVHELSDGIFSKKMTLELEGDEKFELNVLYRTSKPFLDHYFPEMMKQVGYKEAGENPSEPHTKRTSTSHAAEQAVNKRAKIATVQHQSEASNSMVQYAPNKSKSSDKNLHADDDDENIPIKELQKTVRSKPTGLAAPTKSPAQTAPGLEAASKAPVRKQAPAKEVAKAAVRPQAPAKLPAKTAPRVEAASKAPARKQAPAKAAAKEAARAQAPAKAQATEDTLATATGVGKGRGGGGARGGAQHGGGERSAPTKAPKKTKNPLWHDSAVAAEASLNSLLKTPDKRAQTKTCKDVASAQQATNSTLPIYTQGEHVLIGIEDTVVSGLIKKVYRKTDGMPSYLIQMECSEKPAFVQQDEIVGTAVQTRHANGLVEYSCKSPQPKQGIDPPRRSFDPSESRATRFGQDLVGFLKEHRPVCIKDIPIGRYGDFVKNKNTRQSFCVLGKQCIKHRVNNDLLSTTELPPNKNNPRTGGWCSSCHKAMCQEYCHHYYHVKVGVVRLDDKSQLTYG